MRWGRRPSPAEVAKSIAALEHELGIDDESVLAEVEQQKLKRFNSKRGPVLLDKRSPAPVRRGNPELLDWKPGAKLFVEDPDHIHFLTSNVSLSAAAFVRVAPPKSRVVLPDGVRV